MKKVWQIALSVAAIAALTLGIVLTVLFSVNGGGKSAYDVAVENGFHGTEQEWPESLKGQKGDTGATGAAGPAGTNGKDGVTPHIGEDGYWYFGDEKTEFKAVGEDGLTPPRGTFWFDGTAEPDEAELADVREGDFYFRSFSDFSDFTGYRIYRYEGEAWVILADESKQIDPEELTAKTEFHIKSIDDLIAFRDSVNGTGDFSERAETYEGKTVMLVNDIDLANVPWTPIGTKDKPFYGAFDGENHEIRNLHIEINASAQDGAGLFGIIGANKHAATIKNLVVRKAEIINNYEKSGGVKKVGVIVGSVAYDTSRIENVKVYEASIGGIGATYVGGIAGYAAGPISDCYVELTVTGRTYGHVQVGGIAGQAWKDIVGCYTVVNLSGGWSMGGIAGYYMTNQTKVLNCYVKGTVSGAAGGTRSGGVIGSSYSANPRFENCYFDGTVGGNDTNPFIGESNGDKEKENEHLTATQFVNNSWNESLGESYDVYGYQGDVQIKDLTRSDKCSFEADMSYEDFIGKLQTLAD